MLDLKRRLEDVSKEYMVRHPFQLMRQERCALSTYKNETMVPVTVINSTR